MSHQPLRQIASAARPNAFIYKRLRVRSLNDQVPPGFGSLATRRAFAVAAEVEKEDGGFEGRYDAAWKGKGAMDCEGGRESEHGKDETRRTSDETPNRGYLGYLDYASLVPRPSKHFFPSTYPHFPPCSSSSKQIHSPANPEQILSTYASAPLPSDSATLRSLGYHLDSLLRSSSPAQKSAPRKTFQALRTLLARLQATAGEAGLKDWAKERIGFGLPRRMLRSVTEEDVLAAEEAFRRVLPDLIRMKAGGEDAGIDWWEYSKRQNKRRKKRRLQGKGDERVDLIADSNLQDRFVLHAYINHLLYLAARARSEDSYTRIYGFLVEFDLAPDSWTYLTRIILSSEKNQFNEMGKICRMSWSSWRRLSKVAAPFSETAEGEVGRELRGDRVVLNATLWAYAKAGRWDLVGPIYAILRRHLSESSLGKDILIVDPESESFPFPSSQNDFFNSRSINPIFPPTDLIPDKVSYQLLIRALAYHGNLRSALLVVQDMTQDPRCYKMEMSDFVGIFQGFGRFGTVPASPNTDEDWFSSDIESQTSQSSNFPPTISPEPIRVDGGVAARPTSAFRKLTDIWAEKVNSWDRKPEEKEDIDPVTKAIAQEWSLPTLERLFSAFLAITPPPLPDPPKISPDDFVAEGSSRVIAIRGPTERGVFYILTAFARMTGHDAEVMRMVWTDLERKFGPENREGWIGWNVDNRLRRMVEGWDSELGAWTGGDSGESN